MYFLILTLRNNSTLKKLTFKPDNTYTPKVSVLIPARNEEKNIAHCLDSLLVQNYPDYEIIVLDDNSEDRTPDIIKNYEKKYSIIKTYRGKPLPEGWLGKQHACQQLSELAEGEYLYITDADTIHSAESISWAVTNIIKHNADLISAYLYHPMSTPGVALVVPGIYMMTSLLLPLWKIPDNSNPDYSFAIGQLMVCRAESLYAIDGYRDFKDSIVEDLSMARRMKKYGFKTVFIDGKNYASCRMYSSFTETCKGFIKNIFSAVNMSVIAVIGLIIMITAVIELPLVIMIVSVFQQSSIILPLIPVSVFTMMWMAVLKNRNVPLYIIFLYPILYIIIIILAVISTLKTGFGKGALWKGRRVRCRMADRT